MYYVLICQLVVTPRLNSLFRALCAMQKQLECKQNVIASQWGYFDHSRGIMPYKMKCEDQRCKANYILLAF